MTRCRQALSLEHLPMLVATPLCKMRLPNSSWAGQGILGLNHRAMLRIEWCWSFAWQLLMLWLLMPCKQRKAHPEHLN